MSFKKDIILRFEQHYIEEVNGGKVMMYAKNYMYVASCVFTREKPELSMKIQDYLKQRFHMQIIRCCVPNYKDFTADMPR